MGNLRSQPPRQDTIESYVRTVGRIGRLMFFGTNEGELSIEQWRAAAEVARAALAIQSADVFDEQISGAVIEICTALGRDQ